MDCVITAGPRGRARSRSALGRDSSGPTSGHGRHRGAGVPASTNRRCCSPPSDRYSRRTLRGASRLLLRQWRGRTSESAAIRSYADDPQRQRPAGARSSQEHCRAQSLLIAGRSSGRPPAKAHRGPKLRRTRPDIKWQVGAAIWGLRLAQDYPAIRRRASGAAIRRALQRQASTCVMRQHFQPRHAPSGFRRGFAHGSASPVWRGWPVRSGPTVVSINFGSIFYDCDFNHIYFITFIIH